MFTVNNKNSFITFFITILISLIIINWLSKGWFKRIDLTDNEMYSLSESSKSVVGKIDEFLTMKVYFSDNLPGEYGNNRRYLRDMIEEYASYSNNIRYQFFQPDSDEELESEAQSYGISPVQLQVIENDKLEIKKVYMGMVFIYRDEREIIPIIPNQGLEYTITSILKRMVDKNKETVAFATLGEQEIKVDKISEQLRQTYNVSKIDLKTKILDDVSVLLISGVTDSISQEEIENLDQYIANGGNVFIGQNRIKTDLQVQTAEEVQSNIFQLLEKYGLGIKNNLVLDSQCGQIQVLQNRGFFRMQTAVEYPFFPLVRTFAKDEIIVSGLEQIRSMFPSEVYNDTNSTNINLVFSPLLFTSDRSGSMEQFFSLSPVENPAFNTLNEKGKIIGAKSLIYNSNDSLMNQIILIGDSQFFSDDVGGGIPENTDLVLNAVDYLMGDDELVSLRSRKITTRPLEKITDRSRKSWKWANRIVPIILILFLGLLILRKDKMRGKLLEARYE